MVKMIRCHTSLVYGLTTREVDSTPLMSKVSTCVLIERETCCQICKVIITGHLRIEMPNTCCYPSLRMVWMNNWSLTGTQCLHPGSPDPRTINVDTYNDHCTQSETGYTVCSSFTFWSCISKYKNSKKQWWHFFVIDSVLWFTLSAVIVVSKVAMKVSKFCSCSSRWN